MGLTSCPPARLGHGRADEDCGDDRARHREERLLGARLDRDQEKLLRCGLGGPPGRGGWPCVGAGWS